VLVVEDIVVVEIVDTVVVEVWPVVQPIDALYTTATTATVAVANNMAPTRISLPDRSVLIDP